jgi:hypothetical protein
MTAPSKKLSQIPVSSRVTSGWLLKREPEPVTAGKQRDNSQISPLKKPASKSIWKLLGSGQKSTCCER